MLEQNILAERNRKLRKWLLFLFTGGETQGKTADTHHQSSGSTNVIRPPPGSIPINWSYSRVSL